VGLLTILTGRNLPTIWQPREPEPSTFNEKTIADFPRVVEQTGILEREPRDSERIVDLCVACAAGDLLVNAR
jgi:hypothetical protein